LCKDDTEVCLELKQLLEELDQRQKQQQPITVTQEEFEHKLSQKNNSFDLAQSHPLLTDIETKLERIKISISVKK